jgi:hypothetical protein
MTKKNWEEQIIKEVESRFDEEFENNLWQKQDFPDAFVSCPATVKSFLTEQIKLVVESALDATKVERKPMTKQNWEEQFDNEFPDSRQIFQDNNPYDNSDSRRKAIKAYIHQNRKELVESILADIPDDLSIIEWGIAEGDETVIMSTDELKRQLIDKYL